MKSAWSRRSRAAAPAEVVAEARADRACKSGCYQEVGSLRRKNMGHPALAAPFAERLGVFIWKGKWAAAGSQPAV